MEEQYSAVPQREQIMELCVNSGRCLTQKKLPCCFSGRGNADATSGEPKGKRMTFFLQPDMTCSLKGLQEERSRMLYLMDSLVALSLTVEEKEE